MKTDLQRAALLVDYAIHCGSRRALVSAVLEFAALEWEGFADRCRSNSNADEFLRQADLALAEQAKKRSAELRWQKPAALAESSTAAEAGSQNKNNSEPLADPAGERFGDRGAL